MPRGEDVFFRMFYADLSKETIGSMRSALKPLAPCVLGLSIITDECFPDSLKPVKMEEIIATAAKTEPRLTRIMKEVVKRM